jgi:signal transduction histidine kinase
MAKKDIHLYFHDLRAPVVGIRGYLKMLLDGSFGELPGEASEKLQLVYQETERLHGMIEEMVATFSDEE